MARATPTSAVPTLTLALAYGTERTVTLSGQVTAEAAGGLTVTFAGAATGSMKTSADGNYSKVDQAFQPDFAARVGLESLSGPRVRRESLTYIPASGISPRC